MIQALLGSSLGQWAGLALAGLATGYALKAAPGWLASYIGKGIEKGLAAGDAADDELLLALVKWAEKKLPDEGLGQDRYALAAHKAATLLPWLKLDEAKLKEAIEAAVKKMDDELKKHQAPPAP